MSELADRLRAQADDEDNNYDVSNPALLREAADELDRLQAELDAEEERRESAVFNTMLEMNDIHDL